METTKDCVKVNGAARGPWQQKPRTMKQLKFHEQVKGAMAELRAQGAAVSIAAAMRLLRSKKETAMATGGA